MKIILASQSGVRKKILDKYKIDNEVIPSNVDENEVKSFSHSRRSESFIDFKKSC